MTDVVLYESSDGVSTITLNRPERLNAWTTELGNVYFDFLQQAADDDDVKAVIVTGAGRGWCAGADMADLQQMSSGGGIGGGATRPLTFPLTIPKPLIGAINGACAGLGLAQALMLDIRFAAAGAKFTTAFSRRGLIAEHGLSWTMPRLVGLARSLDLLYSARTFLAEEAAELGLVNRVVAPEELMAAARDYALDLARNCSPTSMAVIKSQVYKAVDQPLPDAMRDANRLMLESGTRPDFREGVSSFLEKRPPKFAPVDRAAVKS